MKHTLVIVSIVAIACTAYAAKPEASLTDATARLAHAISAESREAFEHAQGVAASVCEAEHLSRFEGAGVRDLTGLRGPRKVVGPPVAGGQGISAGGTVALDGGLVWKGAACVVGAAAQVRRLL